MQPLAPKGKGFHPASEETLAMSSEARNQAGMLTTSAPIGTERMLSSGPTDKVEVNDQPYNNTQHTLQNPKAEHSFCYSAGTIQRDYGCS